MRAIIKKKKLVALCLLYLLYSKGLVDAVELKLCGTGVEQEHI